MDLPGRTVSFAAHDMARNLFERNYRRLLPKAVKLVIRRKPLSILVALRNGMAQRHSLSSTSKRSRISSKERRAHVQDLDGSVHKVMIGPHIVRHIDGEIYNRAATLS